MSTAGRRPAVAAALLLVTATAAIVLPLWTYAVSLALFGLPHVLVELRYVDERFTARLPGPTVRWLALGLVGIVLLRALAVTDLASSDLLVPTELLLGAALVALALRLTLPTGASAVAVAVVTALVAGVLLAPLVTLVALALLHNLTPVGFLAERLRGDDRRRALLACAIAFGVVPALMLAAPLTEWLQSEAWLRGPLTTGHLDQHLPAFVPVPLLATPFADRLFATAAYLQCLHYFVVLHVLPRLTAGDPAQLGARLPWPRRRTFGVAVIALGVATTLAFAADFTATRSVYAMLAAVHAWVEIPLLVVACGLLPAAAPATAVPA